MTIPRSLACGLALAVLSISDAQAQGTPASPPPAPPAVSITLKPPPARLVLLTDRETSFVVTAVGKDARNLRIVQASLQEATTGALLGANSLRVCLPSDAACQAPVVIRAGQTERIVLRVSDAFRTPGTFTGSVLLAVDDRPGTDAFDLTIVSTTRTRQIGGALLILLGIACAWPVTLGVRQWALRADALRPVAQVLAELDTVVATLRPAHAVATFPQADDRVQRVRARLDPSTLEAGGLLPPRVPNPWRAPVDRSAEFRQLLTEVTVDVAVLGVIAREGVLVAMGHAVPGAPVPAAVLTALRALDQLAGSAATVAAARAALAAILQPAAPAGAAAPAPVSAPAIPTVRELTAQLQRASVAVWLAVAMVTWIVGILALVATSYGFGVGLDYWKCFLWGLGIQGAGQQLQQLTATSVATAFSVSFPKA